MPEDYRDKMTLDEMAENDRAMTDDAAKRFRRYKWYRPKPAFKFISHCIKSTLDRLGVKIMPGMNPKMVDRMLLTRKVKVEKRTHYEGNDVWRNGFYIMQNGELVAFISNVMKFQRSPLLLKGDPDSWSVITNART
jgi:hypothetical protein